MNAAPGAGLTQDIRRWPIALELPASMPAADPVPCAAALNFLSSFCPFLHLTHASPLRIH